MIGTGNGSEILQRNSNNRKSLSDEPVLPARDLRLWAQQRSLREQLERNHFLLERLYAASAGILHSLDSGDVHAAIGEILANLIGSEETAIFQYSSEERRFTFVWSMGVSNEFLCRFSNGTGMMWRAVGEGLTQFRDRQNVTLLQPGEDTLTACVTLKSSGEVVGVILIFGLLPQKNGLEWVDYELLKFLETYGAVAIQLQRLQKDATKP
jgi:hypothetical protein